MKIDAGSFVPGVGVAEGLAGAVNKHAEKSLKNAETKHALAEGDPTAYVLAEKQKTKRLAMIIGASVLVSAGIVGGAMYGINRTTGALDKLADHFIPRPIAAVSGEVAIKDVKLPESIIVGSADGSASFNVTAQNEIGSWGVPGTGFDIPVSTKATVDLRVEDAPHNITLSIEDDTNGTERVKAIVDAGAVWSHLSDPWVDPTLNASNGFLTRLTGDDSQSRAEAVINYAFGQLQECKETIRPTIAPGLSTFIGGMISSTSGMLATKNPGASQELAKLAANPVDVVFVTEQHNGSSSPTSINDLPLPAVTQSVSKDTLASQIGVDPNNISVTSSECTLSLSAMNDILKFNRDAGTLNNLTNFSEQGN